MHLGSQSVSDVLMAYGTIQDQSTGELHPYDPYRIAPYLQPQILDFVSHPPRQAGGHKKWLLTLASRQQGKSATIALAMYIKTAFNQAYSAAIIADDKARAEELFRHIMSCHNHMPDEIRPETIPNRESRQLTFAHGGRILTESANRARGMVGIGQSYDILHMSELPFWENAASVWDGIYPAVTNRKEATIIMESTPAELHKPSSEWYRDMCAEARKGLGRWQFLFAPYYSSMLNERPWDPRSCLTVEELRLLDRYGPRGADPLSAPGDPRYLTLENLAFRRHTMQDNVKLRRYPELFNIWYCLDPISCWVHAGGAAVPSHVLDKHLERVVIPWSPGAKYMEYEKPEQGAQYVIGVDPAGWMGGDHAAFTVLKVWADDWGWEQVAVFSSNEVDPPTFARRIMEAAERFNNADVIVENNGVGLGTLSLLELANDSSGILLKDDYGTERRYHIRNIYYHTLATGANTKPGIPANAKTNAAGLAALIDGLMDKLIIRDEETLEQLRTYKRDKEIEANDRWKILNPGDLQKGRRSRHHWDRVSALVWACFLARQQPVRYKPMTAEQVKSENAAYEEKMKQGITLNEQRAMEADMRKLLRGRAKAARGGKVKYSTKTRYKPPGRRP